MKLRLGRVVPKPEEKLDYYPGWLRPRLEEVWPGWDLKIVAALGMGGSICWQESQEGSVESCRFKIPANYLY